MTSVTIRERPDGGNTARIEYTVNSSGVMSECACELRKWAGSSSCGHSFRLVHRGGCDYLTKARHSELLTRVPEQVKTTDAIFDVCKWLEGEGFHRNFISALECELNRAYEYDFDAWRF